MAEARAAARLVHPAAGSSAEPDGPRGAGEPDGFRTLSCKGIAFCVPERFEPYRLLGKGAYGVVCAARVEGGGEEVAIKKMKGALAEGRNILDGKRALRELMLLRHLQHENVSCISDAWVCASGEDIYLVSDVMDSDMQSIINSSQPLSEAHCQWFVYQILRGLKYVHSANVIHRDLKPSNLLVNANCDLKITDFGLARAIDDDCETSGIMTQYVVTRWYRAPEILLFARRYSFAVDIWSTGCIFAELLRRKPMYQGRDQLHQLRLVLDQLGTPSAEDLSCVDVRLQAAILTLPHSDGRPLRSIFPEAADSTIDLLHNMLKFNPDQRLNTTQALRHPFFSGLHDPEAEPSHSKPFVTPDIDDEDLDWASVRRMIRDEVEVWAAHNGRGSPQRCSAMNLESIDGALPALSDEARAAVDGTMTLCKRAIDTDGEDVAKRMRG